MASSEDLKEVLKDSLENRGVLGQIKARIRAEVFNALDDQTEHKPPLSNENVLINELIREYLEYNKYRYASSVLVAESGMPKVALEREFLRNELNVVEDAPAKTVPLLYSIVSHYVNRHPRSTTAAQGRASHREGNRGAFLQQMEEQLDDGEAPTALSVRGGKR
ncbi:centrosomal protein 20-like [Haliotis rubra]|uniref:centrosomal protein 20-like n=1 Tax=Haliotis rubra TaxID=36100 RepID=UPI001EE4F0DF|nr:centrosomal protein 20-like [Haliotis rubra]